MKSFNKYSIFFTVLILVITYGDGLGQGLNNAHKHSIDSLFTQWSNSDSPGCAIAIYKDGEMVYKRGYGMANLEYNIPITSQTIFHVASISKQFTNFAILLLEEEGKLSIDDDIRKYLPEIHDFGKTITIKHLMNHTSGFRDQWELLAIAGWRLDDVITKDQIMKMILGQRELNFDPGEEYMYCNAGYSILARIVDKVGGIDYADFAKARIFDTLDMIDTHVHDDHELIVPNRSYSYYNYQNGFKKSVLSYANDGATSLFTTAEDLVKWMKNMMDKKVGSSFIDKMHVPGVLNNGEKTSYALGLGVGDYNGLKFAGHGGADAGFRSNIRWYPEEGFGVAVLSNLASFNAAQKVNQITDIVLSDKVKKEKVEEKPKPEEKTIITLSEEELSAFTGKFTINDIGINFNIALKEGALELTQEWDNTKFVIVPFGKENFVKKDDMGLVFNFVKKDEKYDVVNIEQGTNKFKAKRLVEMNYEDGYFEKYEGRYFNEETQAVYTIKVKDDGLVATHMRHNDIPLTTVEEGSFRGSAWWFGEVDFTVGDDSTIEGFMLSGGRVRNLRFVKVE